MAKDPRLKRAGVTGFNKARRTPGHPTKSHIVVAKQGDKIKTIRFGQQGVRGAGKTLRVLKIRHERNPTMQDTMHKMQTLQNYQHDTGHTKLNGRRKKWLLKKCLLMLGLTVNLKIKV